MSIWATTTLGILGAVYAEPLELPEPQAPPPRVVSERGDSPRYYRRRNDIVRPTIRVGLGAAIAAAGARPRPAGRFALDVLPHVEIGLRRGSKLAVAIEPGYSYAKPGEHFFLGGVGPVVRDFGPTWTRRGEETGMMAASVMVHGLAGTVGGDFASGVRESARIGIFVIGLEASHQYVVTPLGAEHDARIMIQVGGPF